MAQQQEDTIMDNIKFTLENLVESIRFDVDYNCLARRKVMPEAGAIDKSLLMRLKQQSDMEDTRYPPGMRRRIFNIYGVKGTIENHALFDQAMLEFKERLNRCAKHETKRTPVQLVAFG